MATRRSATKPAKKGSRPPPLASCTARKSADHIPSAKKAPIGEHARSAGRLLGSHLSVAGGMHFAIESAVRLGFGAVQVFVKNQRQWAAPPIRPEAVADWNAAREKAALGSVVAHATYLINLAAPRDDLYEKSVNAFAVELLRCDTYGIPYLVVHPGAALGQPLPEALRRVALALDLIFANCPGLRATPLLEMTAGQGSTLGRKFEELGGILSESKNADRIGVCIDTCHIFAAGYDIRTPRGYQEMIRAAEGAVGLSRVKCWHLNDSKGDLGSRIDRHEHIGQGKIGLTGFQNVMQDERFRGLPMILETPKDDSGDWDRDNLKRLEQLLKK